MDINKLILPRIRNLQPYSSARSEAIDNEAICMDANENPFVASGRYPDPNQTQLRTAIADFYRLPMEQIMAGNGSDEIIDLLLRAFADVETSTVVIPQPTYGMYEVLAKLQNLDVQRVLLEKDFQLNADAVLDATRGATGIIFLCSPNNPSGNVFQVREVEKVLRNFKGIVVLDQAYVEFSDSPAWRNRINEFPNLVVLQTFSKAWGLASARVGLVFANPLVINALLRMKLPYNVNTSSQQAAIAMLQKSAQVRCWVESLKYERERLVERLAQLPIVERVYPSDANFLLVKFIDANETYDFLKKRGIIVRNRSTDVLCENMLRISIGTVAQNNLLIAVLESFNQAPVGNSSAVQLLNKIV
ncbi:MAG: histidinol-phosphate transaminase [Salinivirgaceae bacterium]